MITSSKNIAFAAVLASSPALAQEIDERSLHSAEAAEIEAESDQAPAPPPIKNEAINFEVMPGDEVSIPVQPKQFSSLDAQPADYPPASWVAGEEGMVRYELSITAQGKVSSCSIVESSGYAALDEKTCQIVTERGIFEPARNEAGKAIASTYTDRQIWRKREPDFPGSATVHVAFTVEKDGTILDCEVIEFSGNVSDRMRRSFEREPCPGTNRTRKEVYRDDEGNPVRKRIELKVVVTAQTLAD